MLGFKMKHSGLPFMRCRSESGSRNAVCEGRGSRLHAQLAEHSTAGRREELHHAAAAVAAAAQGRLRLLQLAV